MAHQPDERTLQPRTLQTGLGDLKKWMKKRSLSKAGIETSAFWKLCTWLEGCQLKVNKNRVVSLDSCEHGGKVADVMAVT